MDERQENSSQTQSSSRGSDAGRISDAEIKSATTKATAGFVWMGSTTVLRQLITWGLTILTARVLDPRDYGLVAFAETILPYLAIAAGLNLQTWIIQADSFDEKEQGQIFSLTLGMGLLMTLLAFLCAPLASAFYQEPRLTLPFQLLTVIFIMRGIAVIPESLLHRELNFRPIALMNLYLGIFRGFLILALACIGFGYWALVAGILVKEIGAAIWLAAVRGLPKKIELNLNLYKTAIAFGLPASFAGICWIIFSTADDVVVGKLFGVEVLGFYTMAFFLSDLPLSRLNSVLNPVLIPYFAQLKTAPDKLYTNYLKIVSGINSIVAPILAGLAVAAPEIVPLILGEKWLPLITPLQVMCFVGFLRSSTGNVSAILYALGHPKKVLRYNIISVLILPICFVLLGLALGINGVYATWLVLFPLTIYIILAIFRDTTGVAISRYIGALRPGTVSAGVMAVVVYGFGALYGGHFDPATLLVVKILLGIACYPLMLFVFFRAEIDAALAISRDMRSSPAS